MEFDSNVPLPSERRRKYNWGEMKVGQSLWKPDMLEAWKAYVSARAYGKRRGWTFVSRKENGSLRIWRAS